MTLQHMILHTLIRTVHQPATIPIANVRRRSFFKILSSPCPRRESSFVVSLNGLLRQAIKTEQNNNKTAQSMKTKTNHSIVTPSEWLAARKELLAEEKRLTRQMDAVSAKRRALPWVKIEKTTSSTAGRGASRSPSFSPGAASWSFSISCSGRAGAKVVLAALTWPTTRTGCSRIWPRAT